MSSADSAASRRRLAVLSRQVEGAHADGAQEPAQLDASPCAGASAVRSLPRFDPYIMETYLDDLRELKRQVYDLFKYKPELLPAVEEGMTKGLFVCCLCDCVCDC